MSLDPEPSYAWWMPSDPEPGYGLGELCITLAAALQHGKAQVDAPGSGDRQQCARAVVPGPWEGGRDAPGYERGVHGLPVRIWGRQCAALPWRPRQPLLHTTSSR